MTVIRPTARHEAWRDHTSYARREHIHGRIVPMERPEGEPGIIAGAALTLLPILAGAGLLVAFGI